MAPPPLPHRHYAPPSHVTEDTPPDLLEGTMDLEVSLPTGKNIVMNVHRSTPMMDLLIQVTTTHRINPGGHVIQLISDNIFLTYKPSTPIGTLDTNIIKIVAKNKINEIANKRKSNLQQQAIERNIRLKVNLPHNQLAVYRVPPKALISDIFTMVCEDKNLDAESHEIRHPVNVDERLRPSCSLSDYQLQEVCVVSSDFRPPPLSVTDLITMSSIAHPEDKKRRGFLGLFARKAKSSTGDSSISSGSAEERSVSPARSDESTEGRPTPLAVTPTPLSTTTTCSNTTTTTVASTSHHNSTISINSSSSQLSRPVSMISLNKAKKRPAPIPPRKEKRLDEAQSKEHVNGKAKPSSVSLSRNGSDSSGCHEADNPSSPGSSEVSSLDATRTEAVTTSSLTISGGSSSLSISACPKGKRKAPSPPKPPLKNGGPTAILESPEEVESNLESKHEVSSPSEAEEQLDSSKLLSEEGGPSSDNVNRDSSIILSAEDGPSSDNVHRDSCKLSSEEEDPSPDKVHSSDICEDIQQDVEEKDDFSEALVTPTHSDNSSDSSLQQNDNTESNVDVSKPNEDENTTNNHPRIETNNDVSVEPSVEPELEPLKAPVEEANNTSPAPQSSSENEVQTRTLSLSDTSATSVEMINLKDIQRPRRHRRKKIPEEFMKNSLKDSSGSSETGKNFGRVDDAEEHIVEQTCMAEDKANIPVNYLKNKDTEVKEVCETTLQNCKMKNMENENQEDKRHSLYNKNQQSPEISNLEMNNQDNSHAKELTIKPEPDNGNCFFKEKLNEDFDLDVDISSITEAYNKAVEEIPKPSVMYVELNDQEESSTDPPPVNGKQIFTSKAKLSLVGNSRKNVSRSSKEHHTKKFGPRSASLNALRPITRSDTEDEEKRLFVSPDDVIAELKSAIDNPDEFPPRILNFKPKSRDWSPEKPPDYNVVLSFSRTADSFRRNRSASSSLERKILTRTSSTSSYESFDSHIAKAEHAIPTRDVRSSTETSYESAPPPFPDSRVPFSSDTDSKASSLAVSRQSSFNDNDSKEFVKPKVPAFSISTYQSRASKISYDKKISRSESLSSFKEFHGTEDKKQQDDAKTTSLTRSDSRRNQVFKSPDLKKATSTTFLNLQFSDWNDSKNKNDNKNDKNDNKNDNKDKNDNKNDDKNDKKNDKNDKKTDSVVRPSMLKTQSKNLFSTAAPSSKRSKDGSIQFELSSSKEPVTFNRPLPNAYGNLRKTKSTFDIRGNDGRGPDVYETAPDSGLANEYMRLQDDFVKWQQQLLQNQRVLHNRVAPIASNPPTLNSVGRIGSGLRLGWKTTPPWLVNNMMNQQASNPQSQPRKPVEITIPIRLVDSDEETNDKETPPPRQVSQSAGQSQFSGPQWRSGPSVPVSAWQERPAPMVRTQPPEAPERSHVPSAMEMQRRPFGKQPGMQTVFQSTPQCRQPQQGLNSFQQIPQQSFQQGPQQTYQHMPQSNYQQMPPSNYQQVPISAYQQVPPSTYQQVPPNTYQQMPPTTYQQVPPTTYQQVPPTTYQQVPPTTYQQVPPTEYQQVPPSSYQQVPPSAYQQVPPATYQQVPQSTFQQMPHSGIQQAPQSSFQQLLSQPDFQQIPQSGYQVSPASIQQPPQSSYQQIPATSFQHGQPNSQFTSRNQPSVLVEPRTQNISDSCINPPCGSDDNINARFSSVVTLSNDKNGQSVPSKDKVWSVVQLNNSETLPTQGRSPAPFQSKIIAGASAPAREEGPDREQRRSPSNTPSGVASVAPISSRLVQQAVQRPLSPGGNGSSVVQPSGVGGAPLSHRISPPRMEREPSPPQHESSPPPFSGVKLRPVETRISPPKTFAFVPKPPSPPNVGLAPLPPPPLQAKVPPPPPPPPGVSDEERRTSTGKKIFSSNNVPQLDAREELMMAIRQFGGSTNLRRSPHPPPQ